MITITKEPQSLYPAYNDSWIEFSSDLVDNNRAEIHIQGFPVFTLYAIDGTYTFNLKEIAKQSLNDLQDFFDNDTLPAFWHKANPNTYTSIEMTIKVYDASNTEDTTTKTYTFFKNVVQVGEQLYSNPYQLLSHSDNGFDHNLTYWEGFPFDFSIKRVESSIKVRNLSTLQTTPDMVVGSPNTMRVYLDKGLANNWTDASYLPLFDTLNPLEILDDNDDVVSNVSIKKKTTPCGVYLKWFNTYGGYSYFLFDEYHIQTTASQSMGEINQNNFINITTASLNNKGYSKSIGNSGSVKYKLITLADQNEVKLLESLINSPAVQMYSSTRRYEEGEWIDIHMSSSSVSSASKKYLQKVTVTIELPETLTQTL